MRFSNESFGWTNLSHVQLAYARRFFLSRYVLSAGVSIGQNRLRTYKTDFLNNAAPQNALTQSAGLTLSDKTDRSRLGVSVADFPEFKAPANVDGVLLCNLYGSHELPVGAGESVIQGGFFLSSDFANTSLLLSLNVYPTSGYYIGTGIRFDDYILIDAGIRLGKSFLLHVSYGRAVNPDFLPKNMCQFGITYRRERKHIRIRIKLPPDTDL